MTNFHQIKLGLKSYNQAFSFIFKNKLGWTFLIPVVLNILLFAVAQNNIIELIDYVKGFVESWSLIKDSEFLSGAVSIVVGFFIEILFFIAFAYLGGYIVLMIMSPLLSYISERTEQILTGKDYSFNLGNLLKDTFRGIIIAIRNMLIELIFLILAFLVGFIPIIGWIGAIFLFFISAYFYGFSFIDYYNERQRLKIKESATLVKKYKGIAISNGSVFALSLLIPFCGSYLALFVAILSVVAATLAMTEASAYKIRN
ncbi:MAG: hypothetical protein DRJ07_14860 [Bacteroidetes bacterium]|nr:MAG: hypothetical protein DRJ07_14860 [Bacteroidota bacterium]